MSPEAMFNLHNGFLLLTCGLFSLIVPFGWAQQRNNKPDEFSCPEEFGYYPHPTDCTQYYVCVFGGALLESCTGGLMYSHDLQTCDWPRNVGCGASPASSANSLNTVSTASGSSQDLGNRYTTPSWKHEIPQPQQDEIPDRHLYEEEDLGPVEEIESDRQQRVYRGQPPTLGQVARDRDGIVRHANALQTSAGPEKIKPVAVVSFGSHHQSLSKGNTTTQSTHDEPNEDDKLELNRVKRDLRNSTTEEKKDSKSRANEGYGLRYRPSQNGDPVPTDSSNIQPIRATTFRPSNISQNTHSSSNAHYTTITGSMRLIKLPTTKAPPIIQASSNPYATVGWSNGPTTSRTTYSNPLVSGSSRFNSYANSDNNLGDYVATDFSIVSVAPNPSPRPRFTTAPPSLVMSYDHRDPKYHSTMYTQLPNTASASHHHAIHNFPNPHNFRRNQVNNYYGSAGPPRFVPYAPPPAFPSYPYPYSPPETSIVTLTYPHSSPVFPNNQMTEYLTQPAPSTTESITLPPVTTSTAAAVQNSTEKPQINSTKLQEGESKHHLNKKSKKGGKPNKDSAHSNTIVHPKDDFESEDDVEEQEDDEDKSAANEEEPEEEEHEQENDDFETYNFEDEHEPPETNLTAKYSAKKTTPVPDKKKEPDENENEEAELEYIFEEEEQDGEDEHEKPEKVEKEEDDEGDEKGDEKDEEENVLQPVKPASNFYKRYITDELDNPFAKPDFDFNSYLTDLAKPIEVPVEETRKKVKKSKKPAINRTLAEGENAESNVHQNISRKNDRIVRLHLYDELPEAIVKRTRATKPTQNPKRVVPMALVHSYKPANYSYPTRYHLHSPSNYNYKTLDNFKYDKTNDYKPFSFGTNYNYSLPDYPRYENPSNSNQQNATDYSDEACGNDDSQCNNEEEEYANAEDGEEEEEGPAGNDENASIQDNEEYYDDYANDYSPEHLKQPLKEPKVPSIPNELKNIDNEVTAPPVNFDDTEEQSEGNEEEENANNEEEEPANENEEPEQGNEEEQEEYVDDSQQPNTDAEETVLSSQQYTTPSKHASHFQSTNKGTVSIVDQVMIPHRQNKFLKNPTTELTNHVSTMITKPSFKPKTTSNVLPTTQLATNSYQMTTYRTPLMRNTLTTPNYAKIKQNFDYKEKIKPSLQYVNKTRTSDYYKFQPPANPTSSYTATSSVVTHPLPLPTRKTEQRYGNKTKAIYHKFPNEANGKNSNKITDTSRVRPTLKPTTVHWPPPSVPPYILEHSVPPVPTTPKSVYNVTKFEPYYNVYDDEAEIYRDIDYGQYNQRKQQDSYQVIQEPHRLQPVQPQPQPSQILTNPPTYNNHNNQNNQEYKLQSDIDGDTQQSEKLPSTRLLLGHNETYSTLSRHENNKPIEYFPFIRSAFSPIVDLTNNKKQLKLTASFQLGNPSNGVRNTTVNNFKPNDLPYETIRSYELNFHNDDSIIGETSQLPAKITSFTRKYQPFNISSTTIRIPKATTSSPIRNFKTPSIRDNFRIIVEPINSKQPSPPTPFTTKPTSSPANTIYTYKMPSTDKFSANYRSLANILSTTYTPYSIIQLQTTTTTTTSKPTVSTTSVPPDSDKQTSNANGRRFYIPRNDLIERKLSFTPVTTTNSPTVPKTESIKSTTKQINLTNNDSHNRIVHSTTHSTLTQNKEGEDNEILYYDDEYYDEGEQPENDDNYIDNKITEFSTSTYTNDVPKPKPSTPPKPKLTKVPFSSTSINVPKSPIRIPNESSTNSLKVEAETKRPHRYKESYSERCPQCNEKPSGRGRNRGSVTYTTGGNEYDAATPANGRTRPTLKPSTAIVGKASESIDIYRNPPKRPDTVYPTPQVDKVAAKCRKDICLLPDCSCGGKDIPGDLPVEETPQIVLLTFDDSVNELNRGLYTDLFEKGRTNPNGCPISATFYVSHEWTDYSMVQNLYANGHEIASHSVSHSFGEQFSQRKWTKEIVGQREILSAYGGVKQEDIRGMRAPFLAVGGNKMFKMLYDANFTYDSSMPIYENRPPSWPYTLDYKLFHDCMIPPCPTRSYPGVWEVPMVMWQDLNGGRCSMGDACSNPPNSDGVYKMLIKNFERHFTTNRAPFGLFYHSSWFTQPHHKEGFIAFLDTIVNMPEVWLVTNWQAIQWARDPTPISRLNSFTPFNCDYPDRPRRCNNPKVCNLWHKSGVRYLKTCQPCPDVYPWTGKTGVRNSRVDNDDTLVE